MIQPFSVVPFPELSLVASLKNKLRFGQALINPNPVITPPLEMGIGQDQFQLQQLGNPSFTTTNQTRLIITTRKEKKSKIQNEFQALAKNPEQWNAAFFSQLAKMYEHLTDGKSVDPQGNQFVTYAIPQKGNKAKNLYSILNAVQQKIQNLPTNTQKLIIELPEQLPPNTDAYQLLQELAERVTLSQYNRNTQKSNPAQSTQLTTVEFVLPQALDSEQASQAIAKGQKLGEAINYCKYWVDLSYNNKSPLYLGQQAQQFASETLQVFSRDKQWLEGKGEGNTKPFGLMLSVASGNNPDPDFAPRMVEMVYTPKDGQYTKTVLLVGKGITWDLGGNNRAATYGHNMTGDMAGAAAVMATLQAIEALQLQGVRVIGLAPFTENALDGGATKPYDIFTARNGKTVQIANTDAEGRLLMADALNYGLETYQPDMAIDMATLTGSKAILLGRQNAIAISGNHKGFIDAAHQIEQQLNRKSGKMYLTPKHSEWISKNGTGKSDLYNSDLPEHNGAKTYGLIPQESTNVAETYNQGIAKGAAFLREFFPEAQKATPWIHMDIAGAEYETRDPRNGEQWATGFGVKDLTTILEAIASGQLDFKRLNFKRKDQ